MFIIHIAIINKHVDSYQYCQVNFYIFITIVNSYTYY